MELISEAKAEVIEVIEDVGDDSKDNKDAIKTNDTLKAQRTDTSTPTPVTNGLPDSQPILITNGTRW